MNAAARIVFAVGVLAFVFCAMVAYGLCWIDETAKGRLMTRCTYRCVRRVYCWRRLPGGVRQCWRCAFRSWLRRSLRDVPSPRNRWRAG